MTDPLFPLIRHYIMPENGIVQPPVKPPEYRMGRRTNKLQFFSKVIETLWKSRNSQVFRYPVNAIECKIPTYHTIIEFPMDLNTIKTRLKNKYYWSVEEAIADINLMFDNCAKFNLPGDPVYTAGTKLRKLFNDKLKVMPEEEIECDDCDDLPKAEDSKKRKRKSKVVGQENSTLAHPAADPVSPTHPGQQKVPVETAGSSIPQMKNKSKTPNLDEKIDLSDQMKSFTSSNCFLEFINNLVILHTGMFTVANIMLGLQDDEEDETENVEFEDDDDEGNDQENANDNVGVKDAVNPEVNKEKMNSAAVADEDKNKMEYEVVANGNRDINKVVNAAVMIDNADADGMEVDEEDYEEFNKKRRIEKMDVDETNEAGKKAAMSSSSESNDESNSSDSDSETSSDEEYHRFVFNK